MSSSPAQEPIPLAKTPVAVRIGDSESLRTAELASRLEEAREEGRAQALEELAGTIDKAVDSLGTACEEAESKVAQSVVEIASEIARELLQAEFDSGHHDIENIVRQALGSSGVKRGAEVAVHLHPTDLFKLQGVPFRSGTRLVADPDIQRGDMHIATEHGTLVRETETIIDAIRESLRSKLA